MNGGSSEKEGQTVYPVSFSDADVGLVLREARPAEEHLAAITRGRLKPKALSVSRRAIP